MSEPRQIFKDYIKTQIRPFLNKKYPTFHLMGSDGLIFPVYSKLDVYKTMLYSKNYNVEWKLLTLENYLEMVQHFHWENACENREMLPTTENDLNWVANWYLSILEEFKDLEEKTKLNFSEMFEIERIELEFVLMFDKKKTLELIDKAQKKLSLSTHKNEIKEFKEYLYDDLYGAYSWIEHDIQYWCTRRGYHYQLKQEINPYKFNNIQSKYMHFIIKKDVEVTEATLLEFATFVNRPIELVRKNIDIKIFRKVKKFIDFLWTDKDSLNI